MVFLNYIDIVDIKGELKSIFANLKMLKLERKHNTNNFLNKYCIFIQ